MRKAVLVILLRLSLVLALFASTALYIEYQRAGDPAFCGAGSGCMAVRMSPYSRLLNVPLPTWGLAAFGGLFVLALVSRTRAQHALVAVLGAAAGLGALVLVYIQAEKIHAFCKWCLLADGSTVVAAVAAVAIYLDVAKGAGSAGAESPGEARLAALLRVPAVSIAWIGAAVAALVIPFVWAQLPVIPPLPPEIAALQVPGKITIVSFTDFECPYCRALHPELEAALHEHGDRLVIVRRMMPLPGHPGALPAALAYECAPLEKRDAMVDELYAAPAELLNHEGLLALAAAKLGMDREALSRCMDAPETRARVEADKALFLRIQGQALPLTYVGDRAILGFRPDQLREAVTRSLAGPRPGLPVSWMFVVLGAVLAGASFVTLRSEKKSR